MKNFFNLRLKKSGTLETNVKVEDLLQMSPEIMIVLSYVRDLAFKTYLEVVITSLISDRKYANATTSTHASGRAFDIRTRTWEQSEIVEFAKEINEQLWYLAPTGKPVAVIEGDHLHFQVAKSNWSFNQRGF